MRTASSNQKVGSLLFALILAITVLLPVAAQADPGHYVQLVKLTNGVDVEASDAPNVPILEPGDPIVWTYIVTNWVDEPLSRIRVVDTQGPVPVLISGDDNNDGLLDPDETWIYEATGFAEDLSVTRPNFNGCPDGSPHYRNEGRVYARSAAGEIFVGYDFSWYCNPPEGPDIDIEKFTNGNQADGAFDADVPVITPGDPVTWTYLVTNTGAVDIVTVDVADDQGVILVFVGGDDGDGILNPGEVWEYEATGIAEDLTTTGFTTVDGCDPDNPRPTYENMGVVTGTSAAGDPVSDVDPSHYCNPPEEEPDIDIEKLTNGNQADGAFDPDVPEIAPGDPVTWTYLVTNTGLVDIVTVDVADDQGLIPVFVGGDDGDGILNPGEVWVYEAHGIAEDLGSTTFTTVDGCDPDNPRPTYENMGTATGTSGSGTMVSDVDPSHYCNPPEDEPPNIDIEKFTNGNQADGAFDADVPNIAPGDVVTWTYLVTNTGGVDLVTVDVTDDQGVVPVFVGGDDGDGLLNPGETWEYEANGIAEVLTTTAFSTEDGCRTNAPRPAYVNMGTAVGTSAAGDTVTDIDPSHYCNPREQRRPAIDIEKLTNGNQADGSFDADVPQIAPGDTVTWTYLVTNIGNVDFPTVDVFDDQGMLPVFVGGDDGDGILEPGEVWEYQASSVAANLTSTGFTTVDGCDPDNPRPAYENMGMVVATTDRNITKTDTDPSHYCNPPENPDVDIEKLTNGNQADGSFDADVPEITPGDPVTWTYLVTNTGDTDLTTVNVTDDQGVVPVFVGGDDGDGILNPGETWEYEANGVAEDLDLTGFTTVDGCDSGDPRPAYENMGIAVGTTDSGTTVTDVDPSHYCEPPINPDIDIEKFTLVVPDAAGGEACDTVGRPLTITLMYTGDGDDATSHTQDSSKVDVTGDPMDEDPVDIVAAKNEDGTDDVVFDGQVALGDTFVLDAAMAGRDEMHSETFVLISDLDGNLLQTVRFHTSCSQPLNPGDQFGAVKVIAFVDKDGNSASLPLPTSEFGEDADTPTGPEAVIGDTIQWTYFVTNPGDVQLANIMVTDDNGSAGDTSDDFSPDPVLDGAFNVGDTDLDGFLDVGEEWLYQAFGVAMFGQYANVSDVVGTPVNDNGDPIGPDVTDEDPSHYIAVFPAGDVCDTLGKPAQLTMIYTGDNVIDHTQDSGKVSVTGDPAFAAEVRIVASEKELGDGKVYFDGNVLLGDTFVIDATLPGDTELRSSTFVTIYDLNDNVLSEIEFHTSCSQPLNLGNQFGSIQLVGFVDKDGGSTGIV